MRKNYIQTNLRPKDKDCPIKREWERGFRSRWVWYIVREGVSSSSFKIGITSASCLPDDERGVGTFREDYFCVNRRFCGDNVSLYRLYLISGVGAVQEKIL